MRSLALLPLALTACWMSEGTPPDEAHDPEGVSIHETLPAQELPDDGDADALDRVAPAACARTDDGQFDFAVRGEGFDAYEGTAIHAAAVEPEGDIELELVAMSQSGVVADGAISLACPRSIHDNGLYPSWALYLDVDGDGACTDADLGYEEQFYAWNEGIEAAVPAPSQWLPVMRLGAFGQEFCAYYEF